MNARLLFNVVVNWESVKAVWTSKFITDASLFGRLLSVCPVLFLFVSECLALLSCISPFLCRVPTIVLPPSTAVTCVD
jgi:hypothetical protein